MASAETFNREGAKVTSETLKNRKVSLAEQLYSFGALMFKIVTTGVFVAIGSKLAAPGAIIMLAMASVSLLNAVDEVPTAFAGIGKKQQVDLVD